MMDNKEFIKLCSRLTRIEERIVSLFKICGRIETAQDRYSEQMDKNKTDLTVIKTWGAVAVFVVPIIMSLIIGRL